MSLMKLDFSNVRFCGREEEMKTLKNSFERSAESSDPKATCVFIEGAAGSGKSTLVETFLASLDEQDIVCCRGKFEEGLQVTEPLSAIEDAVVDLFQGLQDASPSWLKEKDNKELEEDVSTIQTAFPRIRDLVGSSNIGGVNADTDDLQQVSFSSKHNQWSFERLRFSLRALFRIVSRERTVVLFLDDLQWAGQGSLTIVKTLAQDTESGSLLFLGSHRPTNSDHGLSQLKSPMKDATTVQVSNLSVESISHVLSGVLRRDEEDVKSLVEVVHRKTGGNAFFVIQFLQLLSQKGLVSYSTQSYRWEWETHRISSETDISDNILNLVGAKIMTVPKDERVALTTAACLGVSHFDIDTLLCAIDPVSPHENGTEEGKCLVNLDARSHLHADLRRAVDDGYLEELSEGNFKFVHDRVREGAYSLLPEGEKKTELHLTIGRRLRGMMPNSWLGNESASLEYERLLLQAVGQLNLGASLIVDNEEKLDVVQLNYEAARVAMQRSSFFPATDFLRSGVSLLGEEPWRDQYGLTMKMMIALTRMEYCCGMTDSTMEHSRDVISHARSFHDKKVVYHTMVLSLLQQNKGGEARRVVLSVLEELGAPIPKHFVMVKVVHELIQTKRLLREKSDEELLSLPETNDERVNDITEYLERLGELSLNSENPDPVLLALASIRLMKLTLKNGACAMTGMSFVGWGICLAQIGSVSEAYRFGKIGIQYAERKKGGKHDPRVLLAFLLEIFHWKQPYHEGIDPASNALHELWEMGTIEHVLMDSITYILIYYCSGLRLEPLARDIRKYVNLLKDYQVKNMYENHVSFFQMVSNLMEISDDPLVLSGEFMVQDEKLAEWDIDQNTMALQSSYFQRLSLACFFGDYEFASEMSSKMYSPFEEGPDVWVPYKFLFQGLASLALYKTSRKRRHRRHGIAVINRFEKWVRQGVVICLPMVQFLIAEKLSGSVKSKPEEVRSAFDKAISSTRRMGILHVQALANERAGLYFVCHGDPSWASTYLDRARELYSEWGAKAKVRQMNSIYKDYLEQSSASVQVGGTLRARERLADLSTEQLKSLHI